MRTNKNIAARSHVEERCETMINTTPISLVHVLRSLNSMSSDGVRQLHERLMIMHLIDDANRRRATEVERFDVVKRILTAAGVQDLQ